MGDSLYHQTQASLVCIWHSFYSKLHYQGNIFKHGCPLNSILTKEEGDDDGFKNPQHNGLFIQCHSSPVADGLSKEQETGSRNILVRQDDS